MTNYCPKHECERGNFFCRKYEPPVSRDIHQIWDSREADMYDMHMHMHMHCVYATFLNKLSHHGDTLGYGRTSIRIIVSQRYPKNDMDNERLEVVRNSIAPPLMEIPTKCVHHDRGFQVLSALELIPL